MGFIAKQEARFDEYRFGVMSLLMLIQSCYGSIAAYLSVINDNWFFVSINVVAAMGSNAMFIGQAKAKVCLIGFYLSIISSTIVLLADLFLYYI